ncbi:uncharacterized protein MYCFIDRAFT_176147 [Pseudocercospora fijiensis CIRAD86]|uniref:Uncharacterized protein n=1 Tax=Pseudocercospora fijiensis (strain CIRAD86) TaxID=383855 RepID=M3AUG9_PSEFD|nr:uncharacterized protein MYCFIDRAFT_176147 [Pseudocercospora fijiensis CIRAD86]EME80768.1 hypothetical protein MYCFIDRAFT_176147 [Pseudocercospora fijiensis CIRAD86]
MGNRCALELEIICHYLEYSGPRQDSGERLGEYWLHDVLSSQTFSSCSSILGRMIPRNQLEKIFRSEQGGLRGMEVAMQEVGNGPCSATTRIDCAAFSLQLPPCLRSWSLVAS